MDLHRRIVIRNFGWTWYLDGIDTTEIIDTVNTDDRT